MNSIAGKSTGIALLMAAGILAALFAMGVFSATGVGADNVDATAGIAFSQDDGDADGEPMVDTAANGTAGAWTGDTALPLTPAFAQDTFTNSLTVDNDLTALYLAVLGDTGVERDEITVEVDGVELDIEDGYDAAALAVAVGPATYRVNLADGIVNKIEITADDADDTDDPAVTYTITLDYEAANTSDTGSGGTAIDLNLDATAGNTVLVDGPDNGPDATAPQVQLNQNIVIKLPKFTVPSDIDPENISVATSAGSYNPSDVSVSGTTLTLRMGNTGTPTTTASSEPAAMTTLFIAKRVGILNPPQANDAPDSYPITVESTATANAGDQAVGHAIVLRKVSADPNKGTRGTTTTIKGSGLPEGSSTIRITGSDRSNPHNISVTAAKDGTFSHEIATDTKDNDGANVFSKGDNTINVSDARGKLVNATGTFTINPSFSIDPESPIPGQIVTITLSDIDGDVMDASFAGQGIQNAFDGPDDDSLPNDLKVKKVTTDGKNTYQIKMPQGVRRGTVEMRVTVGTAAPLKKTITIATNALQVEPATAVPGQQITITGSGFTKGGSIAASDIKMDSKVVSSTKETVDSTGNINFTVNVVEVGDSPRTIKSGSRNVEVTDNTGRVGTAKITITKAEITLVPAEGLIGSTIAVSGIGFPANDLVLIQYAGTTISTANTDPTGNFSKDVTVPSSAEVGSTAKVKAESQVIKDVSDDADHKTPATALSSATSSTGQAGGTVTVGGSNFKGYVRVTSIKIGGTDVTPVPAPSTDQWGSFTATDVQVPNLTLGTHPVEITVDGKSVTGFIQITDAPTSTDPNDVFASLIADGSLTTVWHLDAATQSWTSFSTNPALADFNDLTEIQGNQVYVLIMTAEGEFRGKALYPGTNQVFIP